MLEAIHRNTRVVVDLSIIKQNISKLKSKLTPSKQVYAVVKANAYGHGMIPVAKAALEAGVQGFCVANVDEALALREARIMEPILILGLSRVEDAPLLARNHITATVDSVEWLLQAAPLLKETPLKVHVAVDSGMGRIGVVNEKELTEVEAVLRNGPFEFEGMFTHFATADEEDTAHLTKQEEKFNGMIGELEERPPHIHCSNSAYAIWHSAGDSDIIRYGIGLYGINPSNGDLCIEDEEHLNPALQWDTEMVKVKKLEIGDTVSYGATYTAREPQWVATLPVGYADGYIRAYNKGEVIVDGVRCPIIGRVCMDQCMIRLPHEYPVGTKVTLLGKNKEEEITAIELAKRADTIAYEVICMISDRVKREYING